MWRYNCVVMSARCAAHDITEVDRLAPNGAELKLGIAIDLDIIHQNDAVSPGRGNIAHFLLQWTLEIEPIFHINVAAVGI